MPNITLTADQDNALKVFSAFLLNKQEKYMIIQGHAGSGKSTLIKYLSKILEAQYQMYALLLKKNKKKGDFEFCLTATTNKAAVVLKEITGIETTTIHSFLKLTVVPNMSTGTVNLTKKKNHSKIYNKLIIIDEASMINDQLFTLLDETAIDCKIVLIGDQYQLAPVNQITSIMETLPCPKAILHEIIRHTGPIKQVSSQFRDTVKTGIFNNIPNSPEVRQVDGDEFKHLIDAAFTAPDYNVTTAKVIAWKNDRVHEYNKHIRNIKGYPTTFMTGETVYTNNPIILGKYNWAVDSAITITNIGSPMLSHDVAGHMLGLDKQGRGFLPDNPLEAKRTLQKIATIAKTDKSKWAVYFAIKETWLDLRPAYASTVHKTQGSQYDTIFIDLSDIGQCYEASTVARLLYVSCSRATKQIYLYGQLPTRYRA